MYTVHTFSILVNFVSFCTQDAAHYRFDPAVSTYDRIRDSRLNTSFFSLAGTLTEANEVIVESLLERV